MSLFELIATLLGLACVLLTVRQHVGCWPTGLAMVAMYIVIFYEAKLYSDMLLQVVYVFLQIYGWYAWVRGGEERRPLRVGRLGRYGWAWSLAACAAGTISLGTGMARYTDAALPYVDAFATSTSLVAQWHLGRKRLESWLFWITVDVVSIGMYVQKRLWPTAVLYVAFLALATWGWFEWRRAWRQPVTA